MRQTIAAIGFPVIIMALVPIRVYLIPRMPFTDEELEALDGPVASAFVSSPPPSVFLVSLTTYTDSGISGREFVRW